MLKGILAPKIESLELPINKVNVSVKVTPFYKDSVSATGVIYRAFTFSNEEIRLKTVYTIKAENLTKAEITSILLHDGQEVAFYPHSDNEEYYTGYVSMRQYNKNEKNRIPSLRIVFTSTGPATYYTDVPDFLMVDTGFINKQYDANIMTVDIGFGI